jgi:hypothetical protein
MQMLEPNSLFASSRLNLDSDGEGVAAGALILHAFLPDPV